MTTLSEEPPDSSIELEVIAASLHDAMEAYRGGASRLEVTVRLDQAGLTPPLDMVREIIRSVPLPIRVMLRDRPDFSVGSDVDLECLIWKATEFASMDIGANVGGRIDGVVAGHIKNGKLDLGALEKITVVTPNLRVTVHHAIEATCDPLETLRTLQTFPSVDRALVSGGAGSVADRIDRLVQMRAAFGHERSLIAGGNVTLDMLKPLRDTMGIRSFHLGRAVRIPEEPGGHVDSAKVRMAAEILGLK